MLPALVVTFSSAFVAGILGFALPSIKIQHDEDIALCQGTPFCIPTSTTQAVSNTSLNVTWDPQFWDGKTKSSSKPPIGGVNLIVSNAINNKVLDNFTNIENSGLYPLDIKPSYLLGNTSNSVHLLIQPVLETGNFGPPNTSVNFMLYSTSSAIPLPVNNTSNSTSQNSNTTSPPPSSSSSNSTNTTTGNSTFKIAIIVVAAVILAIALGVVIASFIKRKQSSTIHQNNNHGIAITRSPVAPIAATVRRSLSNRHRKGPSTGQFFDLDKVGLPRTIPEHYPMT